ncbi:MAG: TonB-dependent receptor domain-containing protein [Akkermansiaceae bacterium]
MNYKQLTNLSSLSLVAMLNLNAVAQEPASDTHKDLGISEVTANEESKADNVVTPDALKRLAPSTLNGIFKLSPEVTVNGGRPQAQQIFVNGLESSLSNVTIDGASQGSVYHHTASIFIEPELLKQVEVFAGAGNALQGLGALNGALSFETKNAFDLLDGGQRFKGITKGSYFGNGDGYKASQTFALGLTDEWGILLSGGYTDRDTYEDGDGNEVELTDYASKNTLFKLSGRLDNGHSLDFGYEYNTSNTFAYDRLNVTGGYLIDLGRDPGILQRNNLSRETFTFRHGFAPSNNDYINLQTDLYLNNQELERETTGDYTKLRTLGFTVKNTSILADQFNSTYGIDYKYSKNDVVNPYSGATNEEETAYGFFIQNDWDFYDRMTLTFGGRYDNYDYDDIAGTNIESSRFSPNATLIYQPTDELEFTAGYAEAYRGVGIREAFIPAEKPADLDGEIAKTYKATARYTKENFYTSASYFNQNIDNFIYPLGGDVSYGDVENKGYEIKVGYQKDKLSTSLSVTDNSPEVKGYEYLDDTGMVIAGRRWIAEASYEVIDSTLTVGGNVEYREKVDEVALGRFPAVAEKDSYVLVNAFVNWDVQQVEGLSLSLNVDNLFDKQYQEHTIYTASGMASPGRQFSIGATYEF